MASGNASVLDDDAARAKSLLRNPGNATRKKRYAVCVAIYEAFLHENHIDPNNVDMPGARDREKDLVGLACALFLKLCGTRK